MKIIHFGLLAALTFTVASCSDNVTEPFENPTKQNMSFKQGARYESSTTVTNPEDNSSTTTTRTWTMVNPNATINGRSNAAIWVDSVFSVGGIFNVADSIVLQQLPGNNDVYRYASLIPELRIPAFLALDLGEGWMQEVKLNASTSTWFVSEIADTIPASTFNVPVPGLTGFKIAISDNAAAAGNENITIGSQSYVTSKTIHTLKVSITALTSFNIPVELTSESLTRTTWTSADLGAIIKEVREGKVISASVPGSTETYKLFPVPGYTSTVTAILAVGG